MYTIVEKRKGLLELEFDDITLPSTILRSLVKRGVDAYTYEPHPLIQACRLHIEAADPMKELKASLKDVEKDWKKFETSLRRRVK